MIPSFADDATGDIWNGVNSNAARPLPRALWPVIRRKLDQLDAVTQLADLQVPPGNRLHALSDDLAGCHAIRLTISTGLSSVSKDTTRHVDCCRPIVHESASNRSVCPRLTRHDG